MITQELMQYAGELLQKKVLARSVVSKVTVWFTGKAYRAPLNMRVDYAPIMQSGWGERAASSTLVNIPGELIEPLNEPQTRLLLDFVTDIMAREVEQKAPRVVPQGGILEVLPIESTGDTE